MTEFRRVLADGDLISQKKLGGWWFFGDKWLPYRNLSREVRFLEERMHAAHAAYKEAQECFVVAQTNVKLDMDLLRMYKMDNSEIAYITPSDESILSRRDGVKYSQGNNNSGQKQKGQNNGGNGNNQQNGGGNGNGNGNNQNQSQNQNQNQQNNKQKGQGRKANLLGLLANAEVTLH